MLNAAADSEPSIEASQNNMQEQDSAALLPLNGKNE